MQEATIPLDQIIGKKITDIRCLYGQEEGWLDTVICYLQLDHEVYIEIPYGKTKDVLIVEIDPKAKTLFAEIHKNQKKNIFNRIINKLFVIQDNPLSHLQNSTIVDYLWHEEAFEKGFFEVDNGCLISDQYMAPTGTGLAGLHYFKDIETLKERKGALVRYSSNIH